MLAASLAGSGTVLAQDEAPFTPEKADVTLGYRLPSLNSIAPLLVAKDQGLWQACGLNSVELINTEEVLPGVVSGSLDVGLVETVDVGQAQVDGLPIKLIAGYRPFSRNVIAVPPGIESVADLDGKDVLLGGTPGTLDFDVRAGMLAEAGYDLSTVNPNYVSVEGGSDAWVALMEEGKLFMSPIFNRHYQRLADQGFNFWVDRQDFGSDHVVGNESFLADNPQSAAAVLCGLDRRHPGLGRPGQHGLHPRTRRSRRHRDHRQHHTCLRRGHQELRPLRRWLGHGADGGAVRGCRER